MMMSNSVKCVVMGLFLPFLCGTLSQAKSIVVNPADPSEFPTRTGCGGSDGKGYWKCCKGYVQGFVDIAQPGEYSITFQAKGNYVEGAKAPIVTFDLDFSEIKQKPIRITSKNAAIYKPANNRVQLEAGRHVITLQFINGPYASGAADARVWFGNLTFTASGSAAS